jgi:hypothetical protein
VELNGYPLYLYRLPPGAVLDVVPPPALSTNATGTLTGPYGTEVFGAGDLALPLQNSPSFARWFVISYSLDSTLTTGWDWAPAAGVGTPNGRSFVQAFAEYLKAQGRKSCGAGCAAAKRCEYRVLGRFSCASSGKTVLLP